MAFCLITIGAPYLSWLRGHQRGLETPHPRLTLSQDFIVDKQVAGKKLGKELHSREGFNMGHATLMFSLKPGDLPVGLRSPLDKGSLRPAL